MTQFIDLELDWNRGAFWTPPAPPTDWSAFAATELPLTEGIHLARGFAGRTHAADDAAAHGCTVIGSHTISADVSPEDQAAAVAAAVPSPAMPLLILPPPVPRADSVALILQTVWDLCNHGLNPRLIYMPEYYWRVLGCPDLYTMCRNNGLALISEPTNIVGMIGYFGDDSPEWAGYGGYRDDEVPLLRVPLENFAAYRGTRDQLAALLAPSPFPTRVPAPADTAAPAPAPADTAAPAPAPADTAAPAPAPADTAAPAPAPAPAVVA